MKLNINVKVTFNLKDKVCEINTVMKNVVSQAHRLYYIDLSVIRLR